MITLMIVINDHYCCKIRVMKRKNGTYGYITTKNPGERNATWHPANKTWATEREAYEHAVGALYPRGASPVNT